MKLNYKQTILIGLAFLSISAFWQMYDNIIPLILKNSFDLGETVTGVIMAADNVLALFLLPFFGSLSDKTNTKIGKRMPFILTGTGLSVIFLLLLPTADRTRNLPFFITVLFLVLLAMGLYRSPSVALMPDLTPKPLRSKGNAVINLMGAVGGVYSLIMIRLLVGSGATPDYFPLFLAIALLMILSVIILFFTIKENKNQPDKNAVKKKNGSKDMQISAESDLTDSGKTASSGSALAPDVRRSLVFMLLSIALWFIAYNAVTTAFSRYATHVWGMENGGYANCLMVATVAAIISYIPIGAISSHIGRKKTILIGVVLLALCYLCAAFYNSYHVTMNIFFGIIGFAWAAINVNSFPMVVEIASSGDVGKYTGYYYTFSMAAQVVTPILSGYLLEHVSYRTLFPYSVFFSVMAFLTMLMVKHGDSRPVKKGSMLENFDVDD
ncbi:MAG: SLC45 family MFS transporter [Lachnospiraceae bacterium]|nr:SLC45 family MFS transporter [Lachnospiraceae bacterium]